MASIKHLWVHRARFPIFSHANVKAWAKRCLTLRELVARNMRAWNLQGRGAFVSPTAEIGRLVLHGDAKNFQIGGESFVGRAYVAAHAKIEIGNNVCINDGVQLLTGSHDVRDVHWTQFNKPIVIEDYAWICTNAILLPGVRIGRGAVIGAGAVVAKDVPARSIVVGNPARVVADNRPTELSYSPTSSLAANSAWLKG